MYNVLKALGILSVCLDASRGDPKHFSQPDDHYRIINPQPEGWRSRCRHRKRWSTIELKEEKS